MSVEADMAGLTEALYQARLAEVARFTTREAELRKALGQLEAQARANRQLPDGRMAGLRAIGGDIQWQGWVARNRAALQMELAQVLAGKAAMLDRLRHAHGRNRAAAELLRKSRQQAQKQREVGRTLQEDSLNLLRHAITGGFR